MAIKKPPVEKKWYLCPYCGAKILLYDNTASCGGVFTTCSRGCRREVEIILKDGEPVKPHN